MKKISSVIWGIVLIAAGALFALNALNITDINIFFDGWWTLFIIVPCAVGLFTEREKTGNIIGLAIGVFLLLCCQDILSFGMLWKLLVPAIIVIVGLKMVFTGFFGNKANEIIAKIKQDGGETKVGCATFSGCDLNFDGEVFEGAELTATFGGVKCDLRNAIIKTLRHNSRHLSWCNSLAPAGIPCHSRPQIVLRQQQFLGHPVYQLY